MKVSYVILAELYLDEGRTDEALEILQRGDTTMSYVWALVGDRERAAQLLQEELQRSEREYVEPVSIAYAYAVLGDDDRALEWLERAYRERAFAVVGIATHRAFRSLHADPRFRDLVQRVGLPPPGVRWPAPE